LESETRKLVESALNALGEYPTGTKGEFQFSNNKDTQSLNLSAVKKNTVLLYFKEKEAILEKTRKELQAKQEAYQDAIIQIILSHRLCMLNFIFCSIFYLFFFKL